MADREFGNKEQIVFGWDETGEVMLVSIPINTLAADLENGTALIRGKLDEVKGLAMQAVKMVRMKKQASGVISPDGRPVINPPLGVA
jgi:hypothetical protein